MPAGMAAPVQRSLVVAGFPRDTFRTNSDVEAPCNVGLFPGHGRAAGFPTVQRNVRA